MWENATKGTQVNLAKTWNMPNDTVPATLYVEGYATSGGVRDVTLQLEYGYWMDTVTSDNINITVVKINLSATDLGGTVTEENEENPGAYVHYNVDNDSDSDNSEGAPKHPGGDYLEDEDSVSGENDPKLSVITLQPSVGSFGLALDPVKVVLKRSNTKLRAWIMQTKASEWALLVDSSQKTWDFSVYAEWAEFAGVMDDIWVEGYDDGTSTLTVEFKNPNDEVIYEDKVNYTFIAADCGNQPTTEDTDYQDDEDPPNDISQRAFFEYFWGNLERCEWSITAGRTGTYNCIAWSVDETGFWYNPWDIDEDFGDNDGWFEDSDMDAFYDDRKTWSLITTGTDEEKAEEAEAMYYPLGSPWHYTQDPYPGPPGYHAARNKGCGCGAGQWIMYESKCGGLDRIEHVWNQLNGSIYGSPARFYE